MSEQVAALLFWLLVLIPIVVFIRQLQQVRSGTRGIWRGTVLFLRFSLIPVLAYVLGFLVLIGFEEVTKIAVIGEGLARTFALVTGIAVGEIMLLTAIFAITAGILCPASK